jgi:predicted DNA-binding transcriptional regulator AlpA
MIKWLTDAPPNGVVRMKQLFEAKEVIPFSKSTLWRLVAAGKFPQPYKMSKGITVWRIREIREWLKDPVAFSVEPKWNSDPDDKQTGDKSES